MLEKQNNVYTLRKTRTTAPSKTGGKIISGGKTKQPTGEAQSSDLENLSELESDLLRDLQSNS